MYNKTKAKVCTGSLLSELLHDTLRVNQGGPNSPDMVEGFLDDIGDYLNKKKCGIVISMNYFYYTSCGQMTSF